MTNRSRVVLYTGVTNSIERRTWYHRHNAAKGFTNRYRVNRLVYFEGFTDVHDAIAREKEVKGWRREKKVNLIETMKPKWRNLERELFGP